MQSRGRPATLPELAPVLGERFVAERLLGRGGMGSVVLARDRVWGTPVALKVASVGTPAASAALRQEFRAFARLDHANVARFYDLVGDRAVCAYSMEFVDGPNLARHVRGELLAGEPLDAAGLVRLDAAAAQLHAGVSALHDAGLVHRDIKPDNVLVDQDSRVVIVDPGIALAVEEGPERTAGASGSLGYMAPEQLAGGPQGGWTDWYSVGIILYELLTGRPPHRGNLDSMISQRELGVMPDLALLPGGEADPWGPVLASLLARSPQDRLAGAARLGARFASTGSALAPPPFVGRQSELARLDVAWQSAGGGRLVAIVGESGTGKSRLVETWVASMRKQGDVRVLASRCDPRESVPFRGLDRLLELLAPRFDLVTEPSWFSALPDPTPIALAAQERVFAELRSRLVAAASVRPLVCWMDDAQWAGADTLALLAELTRPPVPMGLLFVVTARQRSELPAALQPVLVDVLELGALADADVLTVIGGSVDTATAAEITRATRGDPLLVAEAVRALREGLGLQGASGALSRRIERLPEGQRRMFELISLAGGPLDAPSLREFDVGHPLDAVSALLRARLLRLEAGPAGPAVMPAHARLAEMALRTVDQPGRAGRHATLARSLLAAGDTRLELLSTHFELAGDAPAAARFALQAAEIAASRVAYRAARGLIERAFQLHPAIATRESRVLHAEVLAALGLGALSAEAYLRAGGDHGDEALGVRAAEQALMSAGAEEGAARIGDILTRLGHRAPAGPVGLVLGILLAHFRLALGLLPRVADGRTLDALWVAAAGLAPFDALGSHWYGAHYALHARRSGDLAVRARSASLEAILLARVRGTPFGALAPSRLERARRLAEEAGDVGSRAYAAVAAGAVYWTVQDVARGLPACEEALSLYEGHTSRTAHWEASVVRLWLHGLCVIAGREQELRELANFVASDAAARGDPWALNAGLFGLVARRRLEDGDRSAAQAELAAMRARARPGAIFLGEVLADETELDIALAVGDIAGGWQALERGRALRERLRPEVVPALAADYYFRRGAVAAAVAAGRGGLPAAVRKRTARIARADRGRLARCGAVNAEGLTELLDLYMEALAGPVGSDFEARCEAIAQACDAVQHHHWARGARALALAARGERDARWNDGFYVDLFLPGLVPAGGVASAQL